MPSTRFLLRMLVIASALAVAAYASSSPPANGQPGTADQVIRTVLQPDLTLHSTLSLPLLPQATAFGKPFSGFCLCGCGIRCNTSADCGGAACRPFITCCDKTGKIQWNEGIGLSSRRSEVPALNTECK